MKQETHFLNSEFNPADASEVEKKFLLALRTLFGPDKHIEISLKRVMSATSAWVWFIEIAGENLPSHFQGQLVLRILEPNSIKLLDRQVALSKALIKLGFPAPASHWHGVLDNYPAQLQQRLPGRQAIELLGSWKIRQVLLSLGSLQAELHSLPTQEFELPLLSAEDFLKSDLQARLTRLNIVDSSGTFDWLKHTVLENSNPLMDSLVLCHGDFHPLNALVSERGSIGIVDWDDACIGDRHHDVGRTIATFWFGSLLAENSIQRFVLRLTKKWIEKLHLRAYEEKAEVNLEIQRLIWWQVAHLFRFWLQIAELKNGKVIVRESTTTSSITLDLSEKILIKCEILRDEYVGQINA
jgi:aminoglycoside phosphotransferase (APT) family kinase protein